MTIKKNNKYNRNRCVQLWVKKKLRIIFYGSRRGGAVGEAHNDMQEDTEPKLLPVG